MSSDDKTRIITGSPVEPGVQLNGTYEIDERIAFGGMGEVYRGHNIQTGDPVAIKIVLPEFARDKSILALFLKEAQILNHLSHDAIVRYHSISVDPIIGRHYLAMEFVDGLSVAERMAEKPFSPREARKLLQRIASGLALAHEAGVIHRDLSPDNIILPKGKVIKSKIIDFGIARSSSVGGGTLLGGKFAGKYNFVSPEQLGLFGGEVSERSDIYSLGLIIAGAMRGEAIDMSGSQVDVIEKRRVVPDLSFVDGGLRPMLEAMLQPDPDDRPESAEDIVEWLRATTEHSIPPIGGGHGGVRPNAYPNDLDRTDAPRSMPPISVSQAPSEGQSFPPQRAEDHPGSRPPASQPPEGMPLENWRTPNPDDWRRAGSRPGEGVGSAPPFDRQQGSYPQDRGLPPSYPVTGGTGRQTTDTGYGNENQRPAPPALRLPEAANVLSPRPQQPASASVADKKAGSSRVPLYFVIAAVLLAACGAFAWNFGLVGGGAETPVAGPPRLNPTDSGSPQPPPDQGTGIETRPRPRPDGVAWLSSYDGGPCFFATIKSMTETSVEIEAYGESRGSFDRLATAFEAANGIKPMVVSRRVSQEQCPVLDFMKAFQPIAGTNPTLELSSDQFKFNQTISAEIGGMDGRTMNVLLIDGDGVVGSLDAHVKGAKLGFELLVDPNAPAQTTAEATPILIFAIASPSGLSSATTGVSDNVRVVFASEAFPKILEEIQTKRQAVGVAADFFTIGQ